MPCVRPAELPGADSTLSGSDYAAAVEYLFGLINYERIVPASSLSQSFRLDRVRALLEAVGSPHDGLPAIHIAGTKGKGSTAAMLSAMLQAGGIRTGLFTSPHMHRFEERMTVNGEPPCEREIISLVETVRTAAERLVADGRFRPPTFFEVTTAIAWLYFQGRHAEIAVLETGLGGRLDATNVCRPVVTVITSISRDHMHLLGDTLAEIAGEKAGIIKPGVPVISGVTDPSAQQVIARVAAENAAPLVQLGRTLRVRSARRNRPTGPRGPEHWQGDIETPVRTHNAVLAPLAGVHQLDNVALAVAALDELPGRGVPIDPSAVRGLARVRWPVRIEVIRHRPLVIVDSAHNDASIDALLSTIRTIPARRRHVIFGTSRDKDAAAMLRLIAGEFEHVLLTQYRSNPRAFEVAALGDVARANGIDGFTQHPTPAAAWELVQTQVHEDDLVCITGSFFLAAECRELLMTTEPAAAGESRSD